MIENRTPFTAERTWVRDKEGAHHWIVVVKATYDVGESGELTLSEAPVMPLYMPEYHGEPGLSSVRYEADLIAMKPATDVYLNGIAYAPQGRPQTELKVSMRVATLRKELVIYGNREWRGKMGRGIAPSSSTEAFEAMPITYERAYGGTDLADSDPRNHRLDVRNPVGTGVAKDNDVLIGRTAPNVENPSGAPEEGWPAGFGAVASYWSPRKEFAGTYDEAWATRRQPLLPVDYDPRHLLCAPLDQQVPGYLKGGESVELIHLTPGGQLRFRLPTVTLRFVTHLGSVRKEHSSQLVSVIIESEGPRLILVWQTSLACGNQGEYLKKTVIETEDRK